MKKTITVFLLLLCAAGLLLMGCRSADVPAHREPTADQAPASENTTDQTQPDNDAESDTVIGIPGGDDTQIQLGQCGKLRIPYAGAANGVRYITDSSQLPDYPELASYNEAYFRNHALLLVTRTVSSGSAKVDIQSVEMENGVAVVSLAYELPEGLGTADMTTWLLWAEVEQGLDCGWILKNSPESNRNELY